MVNLCTQATDTTLSCHQVILTLKKTTVPQNKQQFKSLKGDTIAIIVHFFGLVYTAKLQAGLNHILNACL